MDSDRQQLPVRKSVFQPPEIQPNSVLSLACAINQHIHTSVGQAKLGGANAFTIFNRI